MCSRDFKATALFLLWMPVLSSIDISYQTANDVLEGPVSNVQPMLMISITSGPNHSHMRKVVRFNDIYLLTVHFVLRNTWLLPCIDSMVCNYRFYVDAMAANLTEALKAEQEVYDDMVFRGPWCPLMDQHPAYINYGNSVIGTEKVEGGYPDYPRRALYKIDWKVCFLQWAAQNRAMAAYHAFVEDDSFLCTAHLLHLTTLLKNLNTDTNTASKHKPFRTGFHKLDGFDDSSTFMSREVAETFANHYPSKDFDCSVMLNMSNVPKKQWLSWGNSWMSKNCDWRSRLLEKFGMAVNQPAISKLMLRCAKRPSKKSASANSTKLEETSSPPNGTVPLPCPHTGMVVHQEGAADVMLRDPKVQHLCEYALFIDKIKDPMHIRKLYHTANASSFHDFTPVFIADGTKGWQEMMKIINAKEEQCRRDGRSLPCLDWRRQRRLQSDSTHRTHSPHTSIPISHDQLTDPGPSVYSK